MTGTYEQRLPRIKEELEDLLYKQIILNSKIAFVQERIKNLEILVQKEKEGK